MKQPGDSARDQRRRSSIEDLGGESYCVLSAAPLEFDADAEIIELSLNQIRALIRELPVTRLAHTVRVSEVKPTIYGFQGETYDYADQPAAEHLQVWRNGYVEFRWRLKSAEQIRGVSTGPAHYPTVVGAEYLWSFLQFLQALYQSPRTSLPLVVTYELLNVRGLRFVDGGFMWPEVSAPWDGDHVLLRPRRVPDLATGAAGLPALLSESLWNAFGFSGQNVFNDAGEILYSRHW